MEGDSQRVQRKRGKEVHFNQCFGPLSCHANVCVCVREDGIISLMVLTHLVLSHDTASWAQSRDCCGAANCEQ